MWKREVVQLGRNGYTTAVVWKREAVQEIVQPAIPGLAIVIPESYTVLVTDR